MSEATEAFWNGQLQNSVIVADAASWDGRYAEMSAAVPQGCGERIATGDDPLQAVWRVSTGRPSHALVFIHGGYWRKFTAAEFGFVAAAAEAADATLYNVDYRLMPAVRMADVVADVVAACEVALRGADRVVIAGHSAGGHLAVEAALRLSRAPAAVVPISGIYELAPLRHAFIQRELALTEEEVAEFSPQGRVAQLSSPVHAMVGADESYEFLRQAVRLVDAVGDSGGEASIRLIPGCHHFSVVADLADRGTEMTRTIAGLLRG